MDVQSYSSRSLPRQLHAYVEETMLKTTSLHPLNVFLFNHSNVVLSQCLILKTLFTPSSNLQILLILLLLTHQQQVSLWQSDIPSSSPTHKLIPHPQTISSIMAPFYPYTPFTPANNTMPHNNHTHAHPCTTLTLMPRTLSTPISIDTIRNQNSSGTSLSLGSIIGVIGGLLFLFGGLAWFVWHTLSVLPRRKKEKLKARRRRREEAERHTERAVKGVRIGGGRVHGHSGPDRGGGREYEYQEYA
jgi:hypothetical protein